MLKKIKNILGIEGVKIALTCPSEFPKDVTAIKGKITLSSKSEKTIEGLTIKLIEKYKRGRNESTLINEYLLSEMDIDADLNISENRSEEMDFSLPVTLLLSDMDKLARDNFLARGFVAIAKKMKDVQSYYRIEVVVKVKGVSLDPIAQQSITFV